MPRRPPRASDAKLRRKNKSVNKPHGLLNGSSVTNKTHAITILVSTEMLGEIDSHIPSHRKIHREQFILNALTSYLAHGEQASFVLQNKITKAISESISEIETGRYEG